MYIKDLEENAEYHFDESKISLSDFKKLMHWKKIRYLHRIDGPAYIAGENTSYYYQNGLLHRFYGPAIENTSGLANAYYLYNNELEKEEYEEAMRFLQENDEVALKMKYTNNLL